MDHTWYMYVTLHTSTVGTATMDTHRTLEKEETSLSYLKRSYKATLNQLSNVDQMALLPRGVVKSTQ